MATEPAPEAAAPDHSHVITLLTQRRDDAAKRVEMIQHENRSVLAQAAGVQRLIDQAQREVDSYNAAITQLEPKASGPVVSIPLGA